MQIHAVIDDDLFQQAIQAIQASGLPGTQAMLEEALRVLIASKSPPQDMAGCLNRFARDSLSFEQERERAWNGMKPLAQENEWQQKNVPATSG